MKKQIIKVQKFGNVIITQYFEDKKIIKTIVKHI
jgi:hypothetical protein